MRRLLILTWIVALSGSVLSAQKTVFENVKIRRHRSVERRLLADKLGKLTFDDSARKLTFKSDAGDDIQVGYDDVEKVVSEVTTHMRGGASRALTFVEIPVGAIAASVIGGAHVDSHWLYLRYRSAGVEVPVLIEIPQATSEQIISKASAVFGDRMERDQFPRESCGYQPR